MSSQTEQKLATGPPTTTLRTIDLIDFYDRFVEFQGSSAFLCDALVALTSTAMELDKTSLHGLHMYAGQVKQQAQEVKKLLQELRNKTVEP